jgi:cytochrome c oxidase accessory protein FixG
MTAPTTTEPLSAQERVLSTLNRDGSRRWIRPRPMPGRFLTARRAVAYGLILVFTLIPFVQFNGRPLVLLDLAARRFTIFGATFLPTDTLLLALFMVAVFVTIFLLTAMFGRVWCGWACPQTVYMEFIFRPIERLFEGTPGRTGAGPLARFRGLKYPVYFVISVYLANTFLAYFVGVERLAVWVTSSPLEHPTGFLVVAATTGLMLFDFGFFREQMCIVACPYGRFQSVMLDRQSTIVGYDGARGEPRGKARRTSGPISLPIALAPRQGDCVDCHMCVATCPTGIDIREGLQMECIHCAQCIDACDSVMSKLGRAPGLIRYASQAEFAGEPRRRLRARIVIYPLLLLALAAMFTFVLATRGAADITVLRGLGKPFTEMEGGLVGNQVRVKIVNRTDRAASYRLGVGGIEGAAVRPEEDPIVVPGGEARTVPALITIPRERFEHGSCDVELAVTDGGSFTSSIRYPLMGPAGHTRGPSGEEGGKP